MPLADDTIKCDLAPLRRDAYGSAQFTDAEWAKLQGVFPSGVCDYSRPGVDRTPTVPWLTYKTGPGGTPLGIPRSEPFGCLSRRSPIGRRNIGRVRLGLTRRGLARRVPGPGRTTRRSWRWCVKRSRGSVRAAFTKRGRVALVATTARRHGNRRVRPGSARIASTGRVSAARGARARPVPREPAQPPRDRGAARQGALHRRQLAAHDRKARRAAALPAAGRACAERAAAQATGTKRSRAVARSRSTSSRRVTDRGTVARISASSNSDDRSRPSWRLR